MAYELHLTKVGGGDLTLEAWGRAVSRNPLLRFNSEPQIAIHPRTGTQIRVPGNEGDVEIYFEDGKKWYRVLHWRDGSVSFKAKPMNPDVWRIVVELATDLKAEIRGDGGELHTPESWPGTKK